MMGVEGGTVCAAIILMATFAVGDPDPKPILVNYFGVPASQYPPEVYRYDPRTNFYGKYSQTAAGYPVLDQGDRYFAPTPPQHGGYVTHEYAVENPRYDHSGHGGYVNSPTVTVRPLQLNNRDYPNGPANYQHREDDGVAAPHHYSSYNGIVRRSGIGENGRDHQGEPGTYAIKGGVFPAGEYEQADHGDGNYRAPDNGGDFNANYRAYGPNDYDDNSRVLGYTSQIHNSGDSRDPIVDKGYDSNYDSGRGSYGIHQFGRDGYYGNQIHKKVPVRGINSKAPQVFYPADSNDPVHGVGRYH